MSREYVEMPQRGRSWKPPSIGIIDTAATSQPLDRIANAKSRTCMSAPPVIPLDVLRKATQRSLHSVLEFVASTGASRLLVHRLTGGRCRAVPDHRQVVFHEQV